MHFIAMLGFGDGGPARLLAGGLVVGIGVATMHYLGMAAMRVYPGQMSVMTGAGSDSFLLPLLLGITLITFVLTLTISLSPTEAEIRDDAEFLSRLETLRRRAG
jgi:NO-binding membrane sensor protein with MHYT domain